MNNSNVYAYLALGDAYEKIENYKKAICVYRELASLGQNVLGINEKIKDLEKILLNQENAKIR